MTFTCNRNTLIPRGLAIAVCLACVAAVQSAPQNAAPNTAPRASTPRKPTTGKRPPLTKADVQKLWGQGAQNLFLNELKLRGLAFEPDEDWVAQLPRPTDQPLAIAELRRRIPPAPDVSAVADQAPNLLAKLKDAAQKRSESEMAPLVHPELLANKARVYDLFDITNYRSHTLGRVAPMDDRRVGVQFFQLTTSQVERLNYAVFSTYHGKIVVRDIIGGTDVAAMFLHDEQQLAVSKLKLVFRALNDGDDTGLKNLCTPGFYENLKSKVGEGGGSVLTRGQHIAVDSISLIPSVSLDEKSARVVVKVGYPTNNGKPLEYYIDFERLDKDLKVVRARDLRGGVIAWDPDIDNYLNRRYGLPDGPPQVNVAETDDSNFLSVSAIRANAARAIESRDAKKLKNCADQLLQLAPTSGEGYGIRATMQHILGNYDEAANDAKKAIDRGGTVFFDVLQYGNSFSHDFAPYILGISKGKIEIRQVMGGPGEEIAAESIKVSFDKSSGGWRGAVKGLLDKPGPFLRVEIVRQKNKGYRFAAVGTQCPDESSARNKALEQYPGGGCGAEGANINTAKSINILVPHNWYQDLKVVLDSIEMAKGGSGDEFRTKLR